MGQKFCTTCGAALSENLKFCEHCGSPIPADIPVPSLQPAGPAARPPGSAPALPLPQRERSIKPVAIVAAIVLVLAIAAGVYVFVLPGLPGTGPSSGLLPGPVTTTITPVPPVITSRPPTITTTSVPVQTPDPFPDARGLNDRFAFGSGSVASEATVYRYWINDTYEWHNDKDNHYYVEKAGAGNKFLIVFVHLQNNGDTRVWFPPAGNIIVINNGVTYTEDRNHFKPDKASDEEATPVEIKEIMYYHKLDGVEYVEDFGFSHGTELAYLYPGASNAVDGYIVYRVPQSLKPEETYVSIAFNGQDQGTWKLA
jgi:hypothetical protein